MDLLEMLTEDVLRDALGPALVDRAYTDIASGKVIRRVRLADGEIAAFWDYLPGSPEMHARGEDDELLMACTCAQFSGDGSCVHLAGLLVAWAAQRESFITLQDTEVAPNEAYAAEAPGKAQLAPPAFDPVADYRKVLSHFTVNELRDIARLRSVPISGIRKDPIVDGLAQAFAQKNKLWEDWPRLSSPARLLVGLLPFLVYYMNVTSLQQAAQPLGVRDKTFNEALDELKSFGLVAVENWGEIHYPAILPFWVPPDEEFVQASALDVKALREQAAPAPQAFYQAATRLLILLQAASEPYLARVEAQMRNMWNKVPFLKGWPVDSKTLDRLGRESKPYQVIQREGVGITPAPSLLMNEAREKLAAAVQVGPEELDFILRLLDFFDLLKIKSGKPIRPEANVISSLLQVGDLQFVKQLFAGYANLETWMDLDLALAHPQSFRLILRDYNRGNYKQMVKTLGALRERLVLLLRRLPVGKWYAVDSLARRAAALPFRSLLQGLFSFGNLEIDGRKINLDKPDDAVQFFARFLESMLSGPLYWQGLVDLAWSADRLAGFRITGLGGAILAQEGDFQMPKPAAGVRSLDFTPEGNLALQLESAGESPIGLTIMLGDVEVNRQGAVVIRPNLTGAGRAFEAGWSAQQILDTLAAAAGKPAPAKLAENLQKWWQNFGSVHIYQDMALIEFSDDYALGELLAGTSLSRYLLYRFSPRLIAIRPEGAAELRDELVKKGYTPKTAV